MGPFGSSQVYLLYIPLQRKRCWTLNLRTLRSIVEVGNYSQHHDNAYTRVLYTVSLRMTLQQKTNTR